MPVGLEGLLSRMALVLGVMALAFLASALIGVVGTPFLQEDFRKAGFTPDDPEADLVILGFDTTLTYAKLDRAIQIARLSRVLRVAFQSLGGKEEGEGV